MANAYPAGAIRVLYFALTAPTVFPSNTPVPASPFMTRAKTRVKEFTNSDVRFFIVLKISALYHHNPHNYSKKNATLYNIQQFPKDTCFIPAGEI